MQNLGYVIFIVFGVWLLALSLFLYRYIALFNKLTKGVEVADLKKVLEKRMKEAAKILDFEGAAYYRDKLKSL